MVLLFSRESAVFGFRYLARRGRLPALNCTTMMIGKKSKRSVTFVLPTADEDNWERTGCGFRALLAYKEYKKTGKISFGTYTISDEKIRDLQVFLRNVKNVAKADKGKLKGDE